MLAMLLGEPGGQRVASITDDAANVVGISAISLLEIQAAAFRSTGSYNLASRVVSEVRGAVSEIVPVTEDIVNLACEMRQMANARISTVDLLIAATAEKFGVIVVHRDPHFAALALGQPVQEVLPDKS